MDSRKGQEQRYIELAKIDGSINIADALTKHVAADSLSKRIGWTNCEIGKGRHKDMPEIADEDY